MVLDLIAGAFLSTSLQFLFDRMASREFLDFFKLHNLNDSIKKLKSSLNSARKVLNDAEEKQITDPNVKVWLDELKDAVYKADDLLDQIAYEALQSKFFSSLNPFNKGELEKDLEEIIESLKDLLQEKEALGLKEGSIGEKSWSPKIPTTSLPEDSGIYGRDKDKEDIVKLLLSADDANGKNLGVVTIVGMGGVGKTTLAQYVYNDTRVQEWFDVKAWVCVSEEFDFLKVTKDVLKEVSSVNCDSMTPNQLHLELAKCLEGKKFMLVLDDVWNDDRDAWGFLLTPLKSGSIQGSKIVVTTRNGTTVASVMSNVSTHPLQVLTEDDCWSVFEKHAFDDRSSCALGGLKKIGREIVRKCKGLPLAAKAIGGLLRSRVDANEWQKILDSNMWEDTKVLPALRLSYHYLPSHLKQCFAYCALFPKVYEFQKEDLVHLWIAESFLVRHKGKEIEDVGNKCFDDLVARSFFQPSTVKRSCFIMHDLIYDLAKFVSGDFCFRFEDDNSSSPSEKARYLSYARNKDDNFKIFDGLGDAPFLRSFLLISWPTQLGSGRKNEKLPDSFKKLKRLRVLSLSKYCTVTKLPKSIGRFRHVRYLNLREMAIKSLPKSVTDLYNLQILILYQCRKLTELPTEMEKLINLWHLDIRGTKLQSMPPQMGKLVKLQKLAYFLVENQVKHSIAELKELNQLQGELCIWNLRNVVNVKDVEEADLKSKKYLKELKFRWDGNQVDSSHAALKQAGKRINISEHQFRVLEQLCPHSKVETLSIHWYQGAIFPDWLGDSTFSKIVSLELNSCKYCSILPPLGELPSLESLSIKKFDAVMDVGPEFLGLRKKPFGSLMSLRFEGMPTWRKWNCDVDGAFLLLRQLYIKDCPNLTKALPSQLPSLIKLEIDGCHQLLVSSLPRVPTILEFKLIDDYRWLQLQKSPSGMQTLKVYRFHSPDSPLKQMGNVLTTLETALASIFVDSQMGDVSTTLVDSPLKVIEQMGVVSTTLESVFIKDCHLKSLCPCEGSLGDFTSLRSLHISRCPYLVSVLEPMHSPLPSLTELYIYDCNELTANFGVQWNLQLLPSLTHLDIDVDSFPLNCPLPSTLTTLRLREVSEMKSLDKKTLPQINLQSILEVGNLQSLQSQPLQHKELRISNWPLPSTLTSLSIAKIKNLNSLDSEKTLQHLTSLTELEICDWPHLQFISEEGLPSTLAYLAIQDLQNLQSLHLQHLTSLEKLMIKECPKFVLIPEEGLPSTLTSLTIWSLENLESLGIEHLTSLKELEITYCPKLESISDDRLPSTLTFLKIQSLGNLQSLEIQHLVSLEMLESKNLVIGDCPKLDLIAIFKHYYR